MGRVWTVVQLTRARVVRRGGRLLPFGNGHFWVRTASEWICLDFRPWVGIQLRWRGPSKPGEFPPPCTPGLRERCAVKKKTATSSGGEEKHLAPMESEVFRDHVALVEHMAMVKYDDGDVRKPGWITLQTRGRSWCAVVKDPDSECSFTVVATTLDEALETVQELLATEDAPWEPDRFLRQQTPKGKKK